uniref:Uncharacterized protein n=1 Tax=Octopus bimaculoides TaxID=37653 RepID=A0A0L8HJ28_OCTBM
MQNLHKRNQFLLVLPGGKCVYCPSNIRQPCRYLPFPSYSEHYYYLAAIQISLLSKYLADKFLTIQ